MAEEVDSEGVTDSPKKGPTLSTSTSSFEALDPHDPNLSRLATTMFNKTSDYLYGELTSTLDDYRLLENMNRATITKYSDMKHIAANVSKSMGELNEKCKNYFFFDNFDNTVNFRQFASTLLAADRSNRRQRGEIRTSSVQARRLFETFRGQIQEFGKTLTVKQRVEIKFFLFHGLLDPLFDATHADRVDAVDELVHLTFTI
jgi:hypothetical protein